MEHTTIGYADRYPYPGLRPFEFEEADIFFGRGVQVDEMLTKLEDHRFLAVVGASGSGKSSLVRAGLLPALKEGYLSGTGSDWRFIVMRPGGVPFNRLAIAYLEAIHGHGSDPQAVARAQATLRSGPQGLVQAIEDAHLEGDPHVLVLVDQFEEIFRFRHRDQSGVEVSETRGKKLSVHEQRNEAAAFVNLLLATARQSRVPIHVVLTMRSDFLGDCDVFYGLPEAVSRSQFLTPRLTRSQLEDAITGPLDYLGGKAEPAVVTRIINETGSDPDMLPLMQHLLTRMWLTAKLEAKGGEEAVLTLKHYESAGGLEEALSLHVDKVYNSLGDEQKKRVAEKAFRALCDWSAENRMTRRLVTVEEVAKVADVSWELVAEVLRPFLSAGRNFLVSSDGMDLKAETIVDISHEALIRQWRRLTEWVKAERESAGRYRQAAETARQWKAGKASLWRPPELDLALKWREEETPTEAWALRYDPDFALSMEFLDASQKARRRKRLTTIGVVGGAFLAVLAFALGANVLRQQARDAEEAALNEKKIAEAAKLRAEVATGNAQKAEEKTQETLDELKESVRERGRTWLRRAREHASTGNRFATVLMAAESVGFEGFGAKNDPEFATMHPRLLDEDLPEEYRQAIELAGEDPRSGLPIWQSSVAPQSVEPNPETGEEAAPGDFKGVSSLAMSPDGRLLAAAGLDGTIRIWDLESGRERPALEHGGEEFYSLCFSPDGTILASGGNENEVKMWNVETGQLLADQTKRNIPEEAEPAEVAPEVEGVEDEAEEEELPRRVLALAFSPDGASLASGGDDGYVRLWTWSRESYVEKLALKEHENSVLTLAYSPAGKALASGGLAGKIVLWMVDSNEEGFEPHAVETLRKHRGNEVVSIAFSPDGRLLASGSADESVLVWRTEELLKAKEHRTDPLRLLEHVNRITHVAFAPDSRTLASSSEDGVIKLWKVEIENGHFAAPRIATLTGHRTGVSSLVFSPDGRTLAGASKRDSIVRVWQVDAPDSKGGSARPDLAAYLTKGWCELDGRNIRYLAATDLPEGREFGFLNVNPAPHTHVDILRQEGKNEAEKTRELARQFEKVGNWRSANLVANSPARSEKEKESLAELVPIESAWLEALEKGRRKYPLPGTPRITIESVQMEMAWVDALSAWVGVKEVTVGQYAAGEGLAHGVQFEDDFPVHSVSWHKANEFCKALTDREGEGIRIPPGYHFSLPTDAQWKAFVGNANQQNSVFGTNRPRKVDDTRAPNNHGLYDVRGNLWEWTLDEWPGPGRHGLRGGSYRSTESELLDENARQSSAANNSYPLYGFRCILVKKSEEE